MKTSKKYSNEIIDCGCYIRAGELQRRKGEEQASSGLKELSQDGVITKKKQPSGSPLWARAWRQWLVSPNVGTERIVEQITVGQCVYDKIEQDVKT